MARLVREGMVGQKFGPTCGKLEIAHFGHQYLEGMYECENVISILYLLFVDDFGIYRNHYRSIKAFYVIPAKPIVQRKAITVWQITSQVG